MTREDYNNKSLNELCENLIEERNIMYNLAMHIKMKKCDIVITYEHLYEIAKYIVEEDNLLMGKDSLSLAKNILEEIEQGNYAKYYLYDIFSKTLQKPTAITKKEDIEHLIYEEWLYTDVYQ